MFRPLTVVRWGIYLALGTAVLSAWMGHRAGASLDYALLRGVFIFVVVSLLGFGAEAVLTLGPASGSAPTLPVARPAVEETNNDE